MGVYYSAVSGYGFVLTNEEYMNCGDLIVARLKLADKMPKWADSFEDEPDEFWSTFLHLGPATASYGVDLDILTSGSYYGDSYDLQHLVCVNGTVNDGWGFSDSQAMPPVTKYEVKDLDYIREYLGFDPETHPMGYYTGVLQS